VHTCTDADLKAATRGYLATDRSTVAMGPALLPTGITASAWREQYAKRSTVGTSDFAAPAYDSVWSWAFTLHDLLVKQRVAVADITNSAEGLKRTHAAMLATNFDGASGSVMFDPDTGDRLGLPLIIKNGQGGAEEVLVGIYLNGTFTKPPVDVVWHSSTWSANGSSWVGAGESFAPTDGASTLFDDVAISGVTPQFSSPFGGELLTIIGHDFRTGTLVVTVGGKVCSRPTLLSPLAITCTTPAGEGARLAVQVSIDGISIKHTTAFAFAYTLPQVSTISR
jgi:hypothetical protein